MLSNMLGWKSWYGLCTKRAIMRLGTSTLALIEPLKRASGSANQRAVASGALCSGSMSRLAFGSFSPLASGSAGRAASR